MIMIMINDNKNSSIVIETVHFLKKRFLHKNKTQKHLNTPKKHNKSHSLGKKCLGKIANKKKIVNNFLFKNKM